MKPSLAQIFPEKPEEQEPTPIDGDGGSDENDLTDITVDIALNGYTVTYNYEDMTCEKYVFLDFDEVLTQLRSKH